MKNINNEEDCKITISGIFKIFELFILLFSILLFVVVVSITFYKGLYIIFNVDKTNEKKIEPIVNNNRVELKGSCLGETFFFNGKNLHLEQYNVCKEVKWKS